MNVRDGLVAVTLAGLLAAAPAHAQSTQSRPGSEAQDSLLNITPPPILSSAGVVSSPPDFPRGRIAGVVFGDYYYNLDGNPLHAYNAAGADTVNPIYIDGAGKPIGRDLNGVAIRRVYLQVDNDLSYRFSTRVRLEADSRALSSDGKITVFLKAAYVRWRSLIPRGDATFGMINTPTFQSAEDFWQYRSIEKTIMDFRGLASSSDLGMSVNGFVDENHLAGYFLMVGDDTGQRPENNRQKRAYAAVPLRWSDIRLEPGVDYQVIQGGRDRALYHVFAGFDRYRVVVGAEAFTQVQHAPSGTFKEPRGVSVFARGPLTTNVNAFARYDVWTPDKRIPNRIDQGLWLAGVDYQPLRDLHVMPNVEGLIYRQKGTAIAPQYNDLQLRLTVAYTFARPQS